MDVSSKSSPAVLGSTLDFEVPVRGVSVGGGRLFISGAYSSLSDPDGGHIKSFSIEDPTSPVLESEYYDPDDRFFDTLIDGDYLYAGSGLGFSLFDVSDETEISLLNSSYENGSYVSLVPGDPTLIYVLDSWSDKILIFERCGTNAPS